MIAMVKKSQVFKDLDGDYGTRVGYVHIAGKDRQNPDRFLRESFKWPQDRSRAAEYVQQLVQAGCCVWKPTSLCDRENSLTHTAPSNVISFEVDQELSDDARELLTSIDATLIASGSPGHVHVKVLLDRDLEHDELARLARHLANACGITGHSDSGGKWQPNDLLRVVGTFNTKHDPPVEVAVMHDGKGTTVEDLRSILATYDAPTRVHVDTGDIDPEVIAWDAVPHPVRFQYGEIPEYISPRTGEHDISAGCWQFWMKCKKRKLSIGQAYYISTELDPEGHIADRYSPRSVASQIRKVYGTQSPKSQSTPSGKEDGIKETGEMTVDSNDTEGDPVFEPEKLRLRRLDEMDEKIFEPIGVGLFEGAVSVLVGDEESAKTTLVLHLLAALATGRGWEPWDIPPGDPRRVVLIATEPNMIKTRLKLLGVAPDSDYLRIFTDEVGGDFPTFPNDAYTDELLAFNPDFLAIDMWADSVEKLNLKDPQDALRAMKTWVKFATQSDAGVLLLAHTNRNNGQATKARDIYGLTVALRKSARATLFSFIHPGDGQLYTGVEKINMQHPGNTHRFKIQSVETGLHSKRGRAITVAQLAAVDTLPNKVWDLYLETQGRTQEKTPDKMTKERALVVVLEKGRTPRRQAIVEVNAVLAEHGGRAMTARSIDNAWQSIRDDGQAGQDRTNANGEKLWSLSYADHDRDEDCNADDDL